jgi:poly-gamma-glutamate synthesis protein (capsule biosynthesis protein)
MSERTLTIGFVGDVMLGRQVNAVGNMEMPGRFWGNALPLMRNADAVFANLESPITARRNAWRRCWKAFRFRADPWMVDALTAGNIRFVSLANNHILDFEAGGLDDTIRNLDAAGIAHAGAGLSLIQAARPAVLEIAGVLVGAISITDTMPEFAAGPDRPGTHYLPIRDDRATLALIATQVDALRGAGAQLVVLSAHWGVNLRPWPSMRFRRFARAAVELGVDVFHGHSAHLIHGIEVVGRRLILYDTGNLLNDYRVFTGFRTGRSCLFLARFTTAGLVGVRAVPMCITPGQVRLAIGKEGGRIASVLIRQSLRLQETIGDCVPETAFTPSTELMEASRPAPAGTETICISSLHSAAEIA